jgi:hypothetical protein
MRKRAFDIFRENATEIALLVGVAMVTAALWPTCGRMALIVPGAVLVWLGLPVRQWFIERPTPAAQERKHS